MLERKDSILQENPIKNLTFSVDFAYKLVVFVIWRRKKIFDGENQQFRAKRKIFLVYCYKISPKVLQCEKKRDII